MSDPTDYTNDSKSYNMPSDYYVTDKGLLIGAGGEGGNVGEYGTFKQGQWTPYAGGDVNSFLGKAGPSLLGQAGNWLKNTFTGKGSMADYGTLLAGVAGLYEAINQGNKPKVWEGTLQKAPIPQPTISPDYLKSINARPYGAAAQGMDPFKYAAPQRPDIQLPTNIGSMSPQEKADLYASYRGMGYTDQELKSRTEKLLGTQSPEDWRTLQNLAGYGPGSIISNFKLPSSIEGMTQEQKADLYRKGIAAGLSDTALRRLADTVYGPQLQTDWDYLRNLAFPKSSTAAPTTSTTTTTAPTATTPATTQTTQPATAQTTQTAKTATSVPANQEPAWKKLVPANWDTFTSQQKIDYFNTATDPFTGTTGFTPRTLLLSGAGMTPADIEWMRSHGYRVQDVGSSATSAATSAPAAPYQAPVMETEQTLEQVTEPAASSTATAQPSWASRLPSGITASAFQNLTPQEKIAIINQQGIRPDELKSYGMSDTDIDWMRSQPNGYKFAMGGIAGLARGGAMPPRYLRGDTDGMADELKSSIDGVQPAKLSHGEFVIPADVVSHLGNGNSDAGAKQLYKMMDRVRQARTGTKKQGKKINPDRFTPGGIAGYAGGGAVAFESGGTAVVNPAGSGGTLTGGLSPWVGDYVAGPQGYLSKAWSLGDQPYQAYTGPLTAGMSPLQNLGITGYQGLTTPTSISDAAKTAGNVATQLSGLQPYTPTTFTNQFTKPTDGYQTTTFTPGFSFTAGDATQFTNQFTAPTTAYQPQTATSGYNAPDAYKMGRFTSGFGYSPDQATQFGNLYQSPTAYQGAQFGNLFQAPGAYQAADMTQGMAPSSYASSAFAPGFNYQARDMQTGLGPVKSVQDYMSQYTGGVSDIAAREATRQADISRQAEQARLAQAGAYGGSRQAIMEAERQRNLGTQISDIRTKGLQEAFDRAQQQRLQEAGLGLQAQQATEQARQFGAERGAQFGLQAQQLGEQSRQFGADFGLKGLQQLLQARQATEASRQFGAQQGMTAAQAAAQYGLAGQQAAESSRQFGAQQDAQARQLQAQFGLSAQQAQEAARQFNAGQKLTAAQLQQQFGLDAQKAEEMSRQFGAQQAAQTAETASRMGLQAQQQSAADRQFAAQQALQVQQLAAQYGLSSQQAQEAARQFNAGQKLTAAQLQSQFGMDARRAEDLSKQFAAQQGMQAAQLAAQYGLSGLQAGEQAKQFGASYQLNALQQALQAAQLQASLGQTGFQTDLQRLQAIMGAGGAQQAAEQAAIDAQIKQFQEAQMWPYKQLQFQQSMLQGLPVSTSTTSPNTSAITDITQGIGGLMNLYKLLGG